MTKGDYSALSTVEGEIIPETHLDQYPGHRRKALLCEPDLGDRVFIKTAGNALQAIPRSYLEQQNLIAVSTPENTKPGDEILVKAPDGIRVLRACIPPNSFPGNIFFVQAPPAVADTGVPLNPNVFGEQNYNNNNQSVVQGQDVEQNDLTLQETEMSSQPTHHYHAEPSAPSFSQLNLNHSTINNNSENAPGDNDDDSNLLLVQVPEGMGPGSKMRVPVPDGRLIEAIVPADPTIKEFYVRIPPPPNNHSDSTSAGMSGNRGLTRALNWSAQV